MKRFIPFLVAVVLMILVAGVYFGSQIIDRITYTKERVDMDAYYKVQEGLAAIVIGTQQMPELARTKGELCYFTLESVWTYLNPDFYYNEEEDLMLYTDAAGTRRVDGAGARSYVDENGAETATPYEIYYKEGSTCYVALEFVKRFTNFGYGLYGNHVVLLTKDEEYRGAEVTKDTELRLRGGVKGPIMRELAAGEVVEVLEPLENWCRVRSDDGMEGYIELKYMGDEKQMTRQVPVNYNVPQNGTLQMDSKVILGFHSIGGKGGNSTLETAISGAKGLNVVAPTWFSLSDETGKFRSFGEESYVDRAHAKGLKVWGVFDDFNYNAEKGTNLSLLPALKSTELRQAMAKDIALSAKSLGLDGVNIDFEKLTAECSEHYAQFIRELSNECHKYDLVLSFDNYVPFHFNTFYRLDVQGKAADYVVIMGYDEHWHGSGDPGSVASLGYVKNGIEKTLEKVPAERVINALPFYTIQWMTEGTKVTDEYLTMDNQENFVQRISTKPVWDEATGQNYLEWTSGNKLYQIWLEDEQSIQAKLNVMSANNLGGAAVWKLGSGTKGVWELINLFGNL